MKPVMQIENYPSGDCFRACLCSILELPIEAIPNFQQNEGANFDELWKAWNDKSPYRLIQVQCETPEETFTDCAVIATGKSPRGNYNHSVVWRNGKIIHDPHPGQLGLKGKPEFFYLLVLKS